MYILQMHYKYLFLVLNLFTVAAATISMYHLRKKGRVTEDLGTPDSAFSLFAENEALFQHWEMY